MQNHTTVRDFVLGPGMIGHLGKSGADHKYDHGHAMVISGPPAHGGAARLAARAALRVGAGLVSIICSRDSVGEHAAQLNAIMLKPAEHSDGYARLIERHRPAAACIGPALGLDDQAGEILRAVLKTEVPLCLDADAITLLAQQQPLARLDQRSILTPHEGEMKRLLPGIFNRTQCRAEIARAAARHVGCTVLFKGVETMIADPAGNVTRVQSNRHSNAAWLATAGSGDVLAGLICGLMARGFDAGHAGAIGADLHLRCASAIGPGLIAEDLPEALPRVLADLLGAE